MRKALGLEIKGQKVKDLIGFKVHLYPLPYHRNSFLGNKVCKFVEINHPEKFFDILDI